MISISLVYVAVALLLVYYLLFTRKKSCKLEGKIPPGPWEIPLLGNLLSVNFTNPLKTFSDVAEKYGPVCKLRIGFDTHYIFSDFKLVKELFMDAEFSDRFVLGGGINDIFANGQMHGIFNTDGKLWEDLRNFSIRQIKEGKTTNESMTMLEVKELLDWLKLQEGKRIEGIFEKFIIVTVNNIWSFIAGQRYAQDDPRVIRLATNVTKDFVDAFQKGTLAFFLPILKDYIPEWSGYAGIRRNADEMLGIFKTAIKEHEATYEAEFPRDFIDVFLKQIKSCKDPKSPFYKETGERQLIGVIRDLFIAGTETVAVSLEWTFLYLCTFPTVQKKLHDELDEVVGNSRHVCLADKPHLPYARAVVAEVMRYSVATTSSVPHIAKRDTLFHGWAIPAGTALYSDIHGIHFSKEIWGDPENFRPERFLSPDGSTFVKHEALVPFGIGRRICAGEPMARTSIFLYFVNIFQRFEFLFDPNDPKANPGLGCRPGLIIAPKPLKMVLKDRH